MVANLYGFENCFRQEGELNCMKQGWDSAIGISIWEQMETGLTKAAGGDKKEKKSNYFGVSIGKIHTPEKKTTIIGCVARHLVLSSLAPENRIGKPRS